MGDRHTIDASLETLRRTAVHAAALSRSAPFGRGRPGAARALEHLGHVQIDTISVVARAHDHILAQRVPGAASGLLDGLVNARVAFEYWAHAAAYLPMADYRHVLPRMRRMADSIRQRPWARQREMDQVLARIRDEGPLRARDFAAPPGHRGGWWQWKPAKRALEALFHTGQLMVAGRDGFEKRFDLSERVLPADIDVGHPDLGEHAAWLVARARRNLGVFSPRQAYHLRREPGLGKAIGRALEGAMERGELLRIRNPALNGATRWYVDAAGLEAASRPIGRQLRALSPFDPLVLHRDRLAVLFGFDYQLECYLPARRRRHGYFSLPLLSGTRFIGRADCKSERSTRRLVIRHLALEETGRGQDPARLLEGFAALARMNDCDHLVLEHASGVDGALARLSGLSGPIEPAGRLG